nr:isoform 2 of transcription factor iiia [Quercus suber]
MTRIGCGIVFRFASKLQKHEKSHDSVEALCCRPVCMNNIANDQCLKAHIQSSHQLGTCEICWTKRHL